MMAWRPKGFQFTARNLVRALCSSETPESKLLMAAMYGEVELFADSTAWNGFLWLVMSTCKIGGQPVYTGVELGAIKDSLPIVWI
ncbi:MAG: hypothetical protein DWC07_07345 [Candidatus Poseidoniales archaeon]|nr:MAG: hypothetical protein DWC07_07345 [Candidatus Poseidoniales archaeon]